jgi:hypothetical protein
MAMQLAHYLSLLWRSQRNLADAFVAVADAHHDEVEIQRTGTRLAAQSQEHAARLRPFVDRYGKDADDEPKDLHGELFRGPRQGALGVLRDLHDLYLMAAECDIVWTLVGQAAQGARDRELFEVVTACEGETSIQLRWLETQLRQRAPQVLVVAR